MRFFEVQFLKSMAEDAVHDAVMNLGDVQDAQGAVRTWAKAAGVKTAEAWIQLFREHREYAQRVIDDVRANASPDLSELTGDELDELLGAVVRENRDRECYALNAAHKASGEAYAQTLAECREMTGEELREMVMA